MAEFCLDCLNRLEGTCYTKWDVSLSWSKDICEGCSQLRLKTAIMKIEKERSRLMTVILSRFSQKKLTAYL